MEKILIISTGGTIVSVNGGSGAAPEAKAALGIAGAAASYLAELGCECEFCSAFGDAGLDSSDLSQREWHELTRIINEAAGRGVRKALVIHGTDTMAYTASWLSLTVHNSAVVLTGSQLTPEAPDFDGTANLRFAADVLCRQTDGVYIAFAGKYFPAPYVHKEDAEGLEAYIATAEPYDWIRAGTEWSAALSETPENGAAERLGLMHIHPLIVPAFDPSWSVLILEGYGAGNMPQRLHKSLCEFWPHGGPVIIAASSCAKGLKRPSLYGGVGIAALAGNGFKAFSQGDYSLEFIVALSYLALTLSPTAPWSVLEKYLEESI